MCATMKNRCNFNSVRDVLLNIHIHEGCIVLFQSRRCRLSLPHSVYTLLGDTATVIAAIMETVGLHAETTSFSRRALLQAWRAEPLRAVCTRIFVFRTFFGRRKWHFICSCCTFRFARTSHNSLISTAVRRNDCTAVPVPTTPSPFPIRPITAILIPSPFSFPSRNTFKIIYKCIYRRASGKEITRLCRCHFFPFLPVHRQAIQCLLSNETRHHYHATLCVSAVRAVGRCLSVCPSVCLSHSCIVFERINISVVLVS